MRNRKSKVENISIMIMKANIISSFLTLNVTFIIVMYLYKSIISRILLRFIIKKKFILYLLKFFEAVF